MEYPIRLLDREEVPSCLYEIPQPPDTLYARGAWPPEGHAYLAVVGSRALSSYGREACETLIASLAGYPITIVSGLALGTDAVAHRAALHAGLHTIAVLGSGTDEASVYPRAHVELSRNILSSGGLILSEKEGGYKARPEDFPKRNRIVVGLSRAVLIIEAGEKSGTLISARLTGEYGRELLCVPHRIGDAHGYGNHLFLRLGATLVTDALHILEALGIPPLKEEKNTPPLEENELKIYELLTQPLPRAELLRISPLPSSVTLTTLVKLELKGLIKEEFGFWCRT